MLVDKRGIVKLVSLLVWLCTLAWIAKAQEAAQEEAPQEAVAGSTTGQTPEAAKPDWDEIDQRLVFLTVQLSTVESSIAATDKSLKKNGYLKIAKEEVAEQARLKNDRDGGPVLWQEFYGLTVEKFYYHPEDGSTVRVKVGAVAARPPQIDYIYRANEANRLRAETDAAEIGSKIEDLLAYRKQLETEQSALWMKIAFRGVSSHELTTKPLYSLNLSAAGADELSKQALECARAGVAFVRSVDSELAAAQKGMDDPTATLDHLVQVTTTARTDLQAKLLAQPILSAAIRDPKMPLAKFSRAAKRIDDLAQNLSDAYRLAAECDEKDDLGGKRSYRGQVQQSAVDLATMLLSADQALTLATSEWNISSLAPNKPEVGPEMSSVDSIPSRLEAAKVTHQSETKLARKTLVATIDVQMNAAADAGDLASVQALQSAKFKAAREGSIADDMTDQAVLAAKKATDQAVEAANVRLAAAYKQAIADYTKARKISEAVAVQDEFIALGLTSTSSTTGAINQPAESITGATGSLGDGVFSPPTILGGLLEVEIPAPIDEVVVGGSGRLLILHLKKLRQLAVFDVSQAKVLKYLPMPSSDIVYAAGSKKLFVGVKDLKRIQRWDLTKLELELTVATPEGGVGALACGAASLGPIVMIGDNSKKYWLMNPTTLKCESFPSKNWGDERGAWGPNNIHVSFDGSTAVACGGGWAGIELASLNANKVTRVQAGGYVHGDALVAGNGALVFPDEGGIVRADLISKVSGIDGKPFPADDPAFSLSFNRDKNIPTLVLYANSDPRPLITLRDLPELKQDSKLPLWQRVHMIPAGKVLVTVGEGASHLVLRNFDLANALEAEGIDYLFVDSAPICQANRGQRYSYKMQVRSKKGGVKIELQSGPKGMTISKDGLVTWTVPARPGEENEGVIIQVSDATGQSIFHTFNIDIGDVTSRP